MSDYNKLYEAGFGLVGGNLWLAPGGHRLVDTATALAELEKEDDD